MCSRVSLVASAVPGTLSRTRLRLRERAPIARAANKFQAVPTDTGVRLYAIGTEVQAIDLPVPAKR